MNHFLKTNNLLLLFGLFFCLPGLSQEVLVPAFQQQLIPGGHDQRKSGQLESSPDTIELPFFDDFSGRGSLPNRFYWTDDNVLINNSYTLDQITIGVATLDALDATGNLNSTGDTPFESDFLTSVPINLEYPGRNDVFLSFFYQPAGLGDYPEVQDSLTVDFWTTDSSRWVTVWAHEGFSRDSIPLVPNDFRQVFIQVRDDRFLRKGFRFRFKNYASPPTDPQYADHAGNVDHWNIDYIYLDTARTAAVTTINDVSMISPLPSLLKSYESIPWTHFPKAKNTEIKQALGISYRNNDITTRNVTRILKITDLNYMVSDSVNGGVANVAPGILNQFQIPFVYPFVYYESDSAVFEVLSYLITESQDFKTNDTVIRQQVFSDYYAYDDGSAENGYGLQGDGTLGGMVACRFHPYKTDTLRAVRIYFNRTRDDATQVFFRLAVWDHDEITNRPGELLYSHDGAKPVYSDKLNAFSTYELDSILILSDDFYVGWIKTSETIMNVGFDQFLNNKNKIFYNLGQDWINTSFTGSLMLRPVMGKQIKNPAGLQKPREILVNVFPNPAREFFQVDWPMTEDPDEWELSLLDLRGRMLYRARGSQNVHAIGHLPEGIYILRLNHAGRPNLSRKLLIIR